MYANAHQASILQETLDTVVLKNVSHKKSVLMVVDIHIGLDLKDNALAQELQNGMETIVFQRLKKLFAS